MKRTLVEEKVPGARRGEARQRQANDALGDEDRFEVVTSENLIINL